MNLLTVISIAAIIFTILITIIGLVKFVVDVSPKKVRWIGIAYVIELIIMMSILLVCILRILKIL